MSVANRLLLVVLAASLAGCVALVGMSGGGSGGATYHSANWKPGQPLGRVLVIAPRYPAYSPEKQPAMDRKVHDAVRNALAKVPGTTLVEGGTLASGGATVLPMSESRAIAAAKKEGADTVLFLALGEFGGDFAALLIPPGWENRTRVIYSLRLVDARTGGLLLDTIRNHSTGGYLSFVNPGAYPSDLQADLSEVLTADR